MLGGNFTVNPRRAAPTAEKQPRGSAPPAIHHKDKSEAPMDANEHSLEFRNTDGSVIDLDDLGIYVQLPELGGSEPPPACPICHRLRIPTGAEGNDRPSPEECDYACGGGYVLPDDPSLPQLWEPS